ncbi:EamA family transporter [Anoxybacteroides amylolyticum]|uniref:EamA-like transporter family protein n=1 Tax=Anoxybacteroides amylolyticum TaxID=294699 RepID=A0A161HY96_9BACL|nr:DMT family transporter [Anoxybacillus amylolyticus]ANB60230.1 eamA-like transporter family protein [Anoxybacillus amylolyticus]
MIYSVYIILGNKVTAHVPPITASAYIALFAALSFFVWGIGSGTLHFQFDVKGRLPIIGTSCVSSVLAMLTFFAGMNIIGPTKAAIVSMMEPVITFSSLDGIFAGKHVLHLNDRWTHCFKWRYARCHRKGTKGREKRNSSLHQRMMEVFFCKMAGISLTII